MSCCTVLLIDSHVRFRQHVVRFLAEHAVDYVVVVGAIGWSEEVPETLVALRPDVVLCGGSSDALPLLQQIPELHALLPHVAIIVLSMLDTEAYRRLAMDWGAAGFLPKDRLATELLPLLARYTHRRRYMPQARGYHDR